jgi:hypothetical protein
LVGSAILVSAPAREAHDAASLRRLVRAAVIPHEHLIETMPSDGRESVREDAIWKINQLGAPAVPFLLPYVRARPRGEWDSEQRDRAIAIVCGLGRAARSAFAALAPLVRARDAELRGTVAVCLANLGVSPRLVAPLILPLLSDRDSSVIRQAVEGARQLGPAAAPALVRLRRLAYRGDVYVRVAAVDAIGNIGRAARTARPTLDVALDDAEADVQAAAAVALVKTRIAPAAGLRHLLDMLAARGAYAEAIDWSRAAAWRLGELATYPEGKAALPALVAALDTAPAEIHDGLAHAIASFGADAAASALVPLTKILDRDSFTNSKEACGALAALGPRILPAVPALVRAASSGGNSSGPASQALLATARRSKDVRLAVKAECAKTSGWELRRCQTLIDQMESR